MARGLACVLAICGYFLLVQAMVSSGRDGHGLIGYGIQMYFPVCATACRDVLSGSQLNCSEVMEMDDVGGMDMGGGDYMTSPDCYATDDAFLQSVAWCIRQRCYVDPKRPDDLPVWQVERWWLDYIPGRLKVQPEPKETYQQALAKVTTPPTEILVAGEPLNQTMLVSDGDYWPDRNADSIFEVAEVTHERYALVVFLSGVIFPVGFSLLRFIPLPKTWLTLFNAWVIDPPAIGRYHKVPIFWGLTNMPTRGQALFIAYLTIINIVLCAVGYSSRQPNSWFPDGTSQEILSYVTNRMGILSFANVPLLILYAGRNNVLLWLTDWSHETFLLLHRYIAAIATLQAVLHSAIYLQIYSADGEHGSESKLPYWYWGAIATIGMSILLPTSILPLRTMVYEAFLLWHVAISVLVVAGCYLHIYYRFDHQWGYEVWIYVAFAVWGFDRVLRILRLARNGVRWAIISVIDDDYIRVDIEGVAGNGYAYLYFPTLTWRVWENHPFSVASTFVRPGTSAEGAQLNIDIEKKGTNAAESGPSSDADSISTAPSAPSKLTLTFLLRTRRGLTALLRSRQKLPVLVESSYGSHLDLSEYPNLVCVAGGVGITSVLPLLRSHPGRSKLLWGVRSSGIVEAMSTELNGFEKEVFVGHRMDVLKELEKVLCFSRENSVVVVSGPASMADDVRNAVCAIGKRGKKASVKLVEESFSW
ncbi:uncharacterized protein A1O5_12718 [Cladophialophora psammophila CBS 110553]|uniref:Ferric oxidoreductase domain-containing protein n=1 Tax=Cladophialophora psammophila CBS 110553 TaxID=1182543 RepID=W9VKQ2_9EURO|nr:uncharacterized protein A1O5_12718 [Cladophialophora psammophila CBS 110553]EXJ56262.1 hypothetical protein A1O5_12718 [Cladophialophora psammophila CBS 110553]